MSTTLNELAVKFKSTHSEKYFEQIYHRVNPSLTRFVRKYLSNFYRANLEKVDLLAEDIVAETWTRVWTKIDTYNPKWAISTWMYRIAINLCLGEINKSKKHNTFSLSSAFDGSSDAEDVFFNQIDDTEYDAIEVLDFELPGFHTEEVANRIVTEALTRLSEYDRELITELTWNGVEYEHLQNRFSEKRNTMKTHIFRARKRFASHAKEVIGEYVDRGEIEIEDLK